jgi:hypothetical protein
VYQNFQYELRLIEASIYKMLQISEFSVCASTYYLSEGFALDVVIGLAKYDFIRRATIL